MFNPMEKQDDEKFQKLRQTLNSSQQENSGTAPQAPKPPQPIQQPQPMAAPKPITPAQPLQTPQPTTPAQPQANQPAAPEQPKMIGPAQQEQEMKNQLMPQPMQPIAPQQPSASSLYTNLNKLPPPAQPPQQSLQPFQQLPQQTDMPMGSLAARSAAFADIGQQQPQESIIRPSVKKLSSFLSRKVKPKTNQPLPKKRGRLAKIARMKR